MRGTKPFLFADLRSERGKDDLLACCLLVARHEIPVWRREPGNADLADPEIVVVDVSSTKPAVGM